MSILDSRIQLLISVKKILIRVLILIYFLIILVQLV